MIEKDIQEINAKALEKVSLAQPILDEIKIYPELTNFHAPVLSKLGDSRWRGHFVLDTLDEVAALYNANCYNDIKNESDVPQEVKKFFMDAIGYKFFNKRN
jgi:hypothetical protein